jgi:myo-inositol-1(or 4)-monophosphatase
LVEEIARIARAAGDELRRRFSGPRQVEMKGAIDIVTDADRAAEEIILQRLASAFPGCPVLAEESGEVRGDGAHALRFLVDPLDGTTNYAHRIPHYSTTLAAVDATGVLAGVVFDPMRDEMYTAGRGLGAFCNGEQLRVAPPVRLADAVLATGFPYDIARQSEVVVGLLSRFLVSSRAVRRFGSAALDLAWVAQSRYDGYWERSLKPWDMAAGILLVTEAGGQVSGFRGEPLDLHAGNCVAAMPGLHVEMVALTSPFA